MSIRLRLAIVFALASMVVLSLGGWLFISMLSSSLLSSIDTQLATQATHGSSYLSSTSPIPATTSGTNAPEYLVQVIDGSGHLRAASPEAPTAPIVPALVIASAKTQQILITQNHLGEHERVLAEPFAGRAGWTVVAGVSLETFDATISRAIKELTIGCALFVILAALGAYLLARAALRPVERLRGEVAAVSVRDIPTAIAVPHTRDEIAALAVTMNELLTRVRTSFERERSLVADASHELRTPFAVLRGELEMAQRPGRTRDELFATVVIAAEEAARLTKIADDLLILSRGDQGQLPMHLEIVDVHEFLQGIVDYAQNRLSEHGITCNVVASGSLRATFDPHRIRQAIENLIDNSVRHCPSGSAITVRAVGEQLGLVVEVSDDGPGFDSDFLPHVFERFRRPDSSRSRERGGAGLGLAIVRTISIAHGGTVFAENGSNGGAVIRLSIPGAVVNDLEP